MNIQTAVSSNKYWPINRLKKPDKGRVCLFTSFTQSKHNLGHRSRATSLTKISVIKERWGTTVREYTWPWAGQHHHLISYQMDARGTLWNIGARAEMQFKEPLDWQVENRKGMMLLCSVSPSQYHEG